MTNIYVSAYSGAGKVVVVAVNTGTSAVNQKFTVQGGTVAQFASYQTASGKNMVTGSAAQVSGSSFTTDLPAQSITTFVGSRTDIPTAVASRPLVEDRFKAGISNGRIVVTPASNEDSYSLAVYAPGGKKAALRTGSRGVSEIPVSTRGMYLVEITSDGSVERKMVPLL